MEFKRKCWSKLEIDFGDVKTWNSQNTPNSFPPPPTIRYTLIARFFKKHYPVQLFQSPPRLIWVDEYMYIITATEMTGKVQGNYITLSLSSVGTNNHALWLAHKSHLIQWSPSIGRLEHVTWILHSYWRITSHALHRSLHYFPTIITLVSDLKCQD